MYCIWSLKQCNSCLHNITCSWIQFSKALYFWVMTHNAYTILRETSKNPPNMDHPKCDWPHWSGPDSPQNPPTLQSTLKHCRILYNVHNETPCDYIIGDVALLLVWTGSIKSQLPSLICQDYMHLVWLLHSFGKCLVSVYICRISCQWSVCVDASVLRLLVLHYLYSYWTFGGMHALIEEANVKEDIACFWGSLCISLTNNPML